MTNLKWGDRVHITLLILYKSNLHKPRNVWWKFYSTELQSMLTMSKYFMCISFLSYESNHYWTVYWTIITKFWLIYCNAAYRRNFMADVLDYTYLKGNVSSSLKLGLGPSPVLVRTVLCWNMTSTNGCTLVWKEVT